MWLYHRLVDEIVFIEKIIGIQCHESITLFKLRTKEVFPQNKIFFVI